MQTIGIGTLARRAGVGVGVGVGVDTVRYYEKSGLLSPSARLASGYRRYSDAEVARWQR
jgi:DNA-binding transcriptional MerR regulator